MLSKINHPTFILTLLFISLTISWSSCRKGEARADKMPESVSAYVYGFTSGIVSKGAPIRIRLTSPVIDESEIGEQAPASAVSFSPSIKGKAVWEDRQTIRFDPEAPLASATTYVATVNLKKVIPGVPADAESFEFDFRTKDQYFEVSVDGLWAPDIKDLKKQELTGSIFTSDIADAAEVEKVLTATQAGKNLEITWQHSPDQLVHDFTVRNVSRSEKASAVELKWNGSPLGVNLKDARSVEVPSLSDFKVMDARVVHDQQQYILLHFSDPLQESQSLNGLVRLSDYGGNFRFLIDGNRVRVYPANQLGGERKVTVSPGVKNTNDKRMQNPSEWIIRFEDAKPQVRLVGRGVIMPNSDGLIFPFEAISLNAVEVEVFKIFNNNILQFLQTNNLDGGDYDLYRVGRVVLQKKVPLKKLNPNASASEWTRYALDLSTLIKEDAEAIYQIRIGFRPDYSTYFCNGAAAANGDESLTLMEPPTDEDGEIPSIMDSWYGIDGWYDDYNWQDREDPCKNAYFNSERFVSRNVIASNLGLIAKGGKDNSYILTVSDLRTAQPISGVQVEFYDFQQQVLKSGQTDSKGMLTVNLERKPFVVVAKSGGQKGYLRLEDGNSLSLSRFDVSGAVVQKGLKGFLYGERGVWRPGDSVFLNFILEDRDGKLPPNYPISFELYDPRGQLQQKRATTTNVDKVYPLHFATGPDAPTGNWIAQVKAGGASFDRIVKIETVKPNRLKIDLGFGKEELSVADEPITANLQAAWLHGAPASGLEAKVEVQLRSVTTTFKKYDNFKFDDPARSFEADPRSLFEGRLDDSGNARFQFSLAQGELLPGKLNASFKTRVFEKTGEFSTDNVSLPYHPFRGYAGISIPANQYGEKRIDMNKSGNITLVALNKDGNPISNRRLSVGMYRVEWRWWWDRGYDYVSQYNSSNHYDALQREELVTNGKGEVQWNVTVSEWGRYLVRVCDTETGHCSGDFFYSGYPWGDDSQARGAAAMLSFSADRSKYGVGESVKLKVPMGEAGRALISLENGARVLESFWVEAKKGENTFTFKTTPEMAPTVYAHVSLIQPHGQVQNDLPIRLYGVIPINVEDPDTRLAPRINMPEELKPQQDVTIEVSETNGKPMAYTVAIVDEGLLGLTRFKTPNPWESFYAREALGVRTWDCYDDVLGAFGGQMERILSIGGDVEIRPGDADERANRFEPVVIHLGPFQLKKGQKAKHQVRIPNYIGAVRTMVVAVQDGAYGSAEKSTPVKKPLMVLATLPRVLGPGEEFKLPVNVFAMDNKVKNATVSVKESSGLVKIEGPASKSVQFARAGDELVAFDVKVAERVGVARFTVTAEGAGEKSTQEIEIQVRNANPLVVDVYDKVLAPGEEWKRAFSPIGMQGTNEAMLEVSSIPPINLGRRLDYLIQYPYGCLEQTLSGGFPQLYVNKLLELNDDQKKRVPNNIRGTIERLKQFQTGRGGFAYWPGNSAPDPWSTSYAGHFLLEAKALGYSVPPALLNNWKDYQKKAARLWDPQAQEYGMYGRNSSELDQAYRLYTLALAKEPDQGAMNRLREMKGLTMQAKWRLAAAYSLTGKTEVARELTKGLGMQVAAYSELSYTYGSDTRDRAMILETLVLLGDRTEAANLVKYLSDQLSNEQWHSTQTIAYSLLAIGKFVGNTEVENRLQFAYQLEGKQSVNAGSEFPIMQIALPEDQKGSFTVKNTSKGTIFARAILKGKPAAGAETSQANNLRLAVTYKDLNGKTIDPSSLPQGTDFIAEVRVTHPGARPIPYREMALNQIFPSGWEILNTRMDEVQNFQAANAPEYQDFRDDRVYTFFSIQQGQTQTYYVQLNAAYQGRYYLPAVSCEAMYDNSINAREAGRWVEVTRPRES